MEEAFGEEQLMAPLTKLFGQKITKFPGMMPTSVDRTNVSLLQFGYCASSKADGDAVLGFIHDNKLVLMRRNKQTKSFLLSTNFKKDFVFDGEYIAHRNRFLIFDTLVFQSEPLYRENYPIRIELANYFINELCPKTELHLYRNTIIADDTVKPLPSNYTHGITWKTETISLQVKPPYAAWDAAQLWYNRNLLPYGCDGIIFTRLWCGYRPFSEDLEAVLKWKEEVTADFLVKTNAKDKIACDQYGNAIYLPQQWAFPADCEQQNALLYSLYNADAVPVSSCVLINEEQKLLATNQICEFAWNKELCIWVWIRSRTDKLTPNNVHTVIACVKSMRDNITIEEIAEAAS